MNKVIQVLLIMTVTILALYIVSAQRPTDRGLPDLVPSLDSYSITCKGNICEGSIKTTIKNNGRTASLPNMLRIELLTPEYGFLGWGAHIIPEIGPNGSYSHSMPVYLTNINPGTYRLRIYADYMNNVIEANETNNIVMKKIAF